MGGIILLRTDNGAVRLMNGEKINMKKKTLLTSLCCLLVCCTVMLSGCGLSLISSSANGVSSASINEQGELIFTYANGTTQNVGRVVGDKGATGDDGTLVLSEDDDSTAATAAGLRSAVKVVCGFTKTVQIGGWFGMGGETSQQSYTQSGAGVIYKLDKDAGDAFIITNYHVIYDGSSNAENGVSDMINLYLYGSETEEQAIPATFVGGSIYDDIAVLYVDNSSLLTESGVKAVTVADSDDVRAGEKAIAVGNPEAQGISATEGIVSVESEHITMGAIDNSGAVTFRVMRIDTAVNSGNSGGGLYNSRGELIGIVNARDGDYRVENIGYAIPSNVACAVADNIIDNCFGKENKTIVRCALGVVVDATDSKAIYDGETGSYSIVERVIVDDFREGTPAAEIFKVGDVLLSFTHNGTTRSITRQHHLIDYMVDVRVGDEIGITVNRGGEEIYLTVTVGEENVSYY